MTVADTPAVMDIELQVYPFPWTLSIFRDCLQVGYSCWVCEEAGTLLGYGVMSSGAGEAHLLNLCIRPSAQGRGLGRRMLRHLMGVARAHRADTLLLEVRPSNIPAWRLYHSMGFNEIGTRRNYYPATGGREDALVMACSLLD